MRGHAREPFGPDRVVAHSGKRVDRKAWHLAKVDAAHDAVDFRMHRVETVIDAAVDGGPQHAVFA